MPSEMLLQILEAERDLGDRVSNIVLMGMGEPLDNYDNVIKFLKLVNNESGLNIGLRHISLSTCGLVDKMDRLADEGLPITLSVSLHAPNDEKRRQTMPIAKRYSVNELIDACKRYIEKTGRRISFEYALISGVNDSKEDAHELGRLLSGMLCHLNLIPVNPIKEKNFVRSEKNAIKLFTETVELYKINVTVRRKLGSDINASCGQLRADDKDKSKKEENA
jgi:23S rRNA (adenine2503-C2)-methyltransferase